VANNTTAKVNLAKPVSPAPVSGAPAPWAPVSAAPVSGAPVSAVPVSGAPVSAVPVSGAPVSGVPVSAVPVSGMPVSGVPVSGPAAGGPSGVGGPRPPVMVPPQGPGYPARPAPAGPALPPRPTFFDRYWPAPAAPAHQAALAATAGVALTAALLLTVTRPGLGWLLVGLVAAGGMTLTVRATRVALSWDRLIWAAAALALLSVGTVRAAGWLFVLCVPVAAVCGTIALAGGRNVRGLAFAAITTPVAALRGILWFNRGVTQIHRSGSAGRWLRLAAAAGVGVALLIVFGALFASADPAFAKLVDRIVPAIGEGEVIGGAFRFVVFGWGALGAAYLASRPPALDRLASGTRKPLRRLEWLLPVALLDGLFAAFVAVQMGAWFGGKDYVLRTTGLTYAEYARRGFWQLVVVTILTLAVIAVAARKASRVGTGDRVALRAALGALATLALIVVASALARMAAYESVYGLTRLRLLVAACEVWFGLIFVMVLASGVHLRDHGRVKGGWLARAIVGTGVAMLIAIAAVNPDRLIADRNIDRYEQGGRLDVWYLNGLSADAAPALDRLPEPARSCALIRIAADVAGDPDAWYEFNLGRWIARDIEPGVNNPRCYDLFGP
jgi:hypothetical protein